MVMIPSDVGVQVRTQTEPGTHAVRSISDIPSDLPALQQGQAFRARIQEVLPENSYKAVVAGRLMTLSLAEGAQADDVLDLVVVGQQGGVVVARRGSPATVVAAAEAEFDNARLSSTGQLIASLLDAEGESAPAAIFSRAGPVLARLPANGAEIARELPAALGRAVTGSGMFYESHQAQWVLGERPLASLLSEPQGQLSEAAVPRRPGTEPRESALAERREGGVSGERQVAAPAIPEELRTLVQQQLEAGASHRLVWQGEVWPGQQMDWEIQPDEGGRAEPGEQLPAWRTRVSLELPGLGQVEALLALVASVVALIVEAEHPRSRAALQAALPNLRGGLGAAGLQLASATVNAGGR